MQKTENQQEFFGSVTTKKIIYQNVMVLLVHIAKYGRLNTAFIWNGFHISV